MTNTKRTKSFVFPTHVSAWLCLCTTCASHLQSVCPHELLCSSSGSRYGDTGVAGDQYRGAGQDVSVHEAGRHGAKVRVKCSGCCSSSVGVGCKAGRD